jgi:heme oxygenase
MGSANHRDMTIEAIFIEREPGSRRAPSPDFLARLKQETAAEHAAIEAAADIMHEAFNHVDYRRYLEQSYAFYKPVERLLEEARVWETLGLPGAERNKLPLLARDLESLGSDPGGLPRAAPPELGDVDQAVGCAYVLEGSTLGGRIISRHVQACLGVDVPRNFLECYGAKTGERWQEFRAALARHARGRDVENRVITGAKATFSAFTRWLIASRPG